MKKINFLFLATTIICSPNRSYAMLDQPYGEDKENSYTSQPTHKVIFKKTKSNIHTTTNKKNGLKERSNLPVSKSKTLPYGKISKNLPLPQTKLTTQDLTKKEIFDNSIAQEREQAKKNFTHSKEQSSLSEIFNNLSQISSRNDQKILRTFLKGIQTLEQDSYKDDDDIWARLAYAVELVQFQDLPLTLKVRNNESHTSCNRKKVLSWIYDLYGTIELTRFIHDKDAMHMERGAEYFARACINDGRGTFSALQRAQQDEDEGAKFFYESVTKKLSEKIKINVDEFITDSLHDRRLLTLKDDAKDQYIAYWTEGRWKKNPEEALYYTQDVINTIEGSLEETEEGRDKLYEIITQQNDFFKRAREGQSKFLSVWADIVHEKLYVFGNNEDELNDQHNFENELPEIITTTLSDKKDDPDIQKLYLQGLIFGKYGFKKDQEAAKAFLAGNEHYTTLMTCFFRAKNGFQNLMYARDIKACEKDFKELILAFIETALRVPRKNSSLVAEPLIQKEMQHQVEIKQLNRQLKLKTQGQEPKHDRAKKNFTHSKEQSSLSEIFNNLSQISSRNDQEILRAFLKGIQILEQGTHKEDDDTWARLADVFELVQFQDLPLTLKARNNESHTSCNRKKVLSWIYNLYGAIELTRFIHDEDAMHMERGAEYFARSCINDGREILSALQRAQQDGDKGEKFFYESVTKKLSEKIKINVDEFITDSLHDRRLLTLKDDAKDQYIAYWTEGRWKKNPAEALYYTQDVINTIEGSLEETEEGRDKLYEIITQQNDFFKRARDGQSKFLAVWADIVHEKLYVFGNNEDELNDQHNFENELPEIITTTLSDKKDDPDIQKLYLQGLIFGKYGFKKDQEAAKAFLAGNEHYTTLMTCFFRAMNGFQNLMYARDIKACEKDLKELVLAFTETALRMPRKNSSLAAEPFIQKELQHHVELPAQAKHEVAEIFITSIEKEERFLNESAIRQIEPLVALIETAPAQLVHAADLSDIQATQIKPAVEPVVLVQEKVGYAANLSDVQAVQIKPSVEFIKRVTPLKELREVRIELAVEPTVPVEEKVGYVADFFDSKVVQIKPAVEFIERVTALKEFREVRIEPVVEPAVPVQKKVGYVADFFDSKTVQIKPIAELVRPIEKETNPPQATPTPQKTQAAPAKMTKTLRTLRRGAREVISAPAFQLKKAERPAIKSQKLLTKIELRKAPQAKRWGGETQKKLRKIELRIAAQTKRWRVEAQKKLTQIELRKTVQANRSRAETQKKLRKFELRKALQAKRWRAEAQKKLTTIELRKALQAKRWRVEAQKKLTKVALRKALQAKRRRVETQKKQTKIALRKAPKNERLHRKVVRRHAAHKNSRR